MSSFIRMLMQLALGVLVTLPLTACAATVSSKTLEGKVLEGGSHKPIANAMVIVRWIGDIGGIGHGSSVCYHVEVVTTDNQGQFHVPAWKKPSPYGDIAHPRTARYAHAPGYVFVRADKETIYLQPFAGGRGERLRYLQRSAVSCHQAGESKKNLLPLAKTLYEEARDLAKTEDEKKIVNNLLFSLEIIDLGYEAAERRDIERRRGQK